jgi:murein DD-endopeptidase MepM/ murein hydrolase activator NlpD
MMGRRLAFVVLAVAVTFGGLALGGVARDHLASRTAPPPPAAAPAAIGAPSPEPDPVTRTSEVTLRRGDSLVRALEREGIAFKVGNDIALALAKGGADLRRLKPGDGLRLTWTLDGEPIALDWEPSPWLGYAVIATEDGWTVRRSETRPDVRLAVVRGEVKTSLFQAMDDAGENAQLVLEFVEIFSSDFDFTADTKPGDRFRLLVEKRYAGEQFVDYGHILAAQFMSDGRLLTGVGFEPPRGRFAYFDAGGRSLRKSFLKSPLEFTRITSGFTYKRPHPILGGVRPHLALDYAAPVGTAVRAVADAVVTSAGWNGGYGLSVRLRHRAGYETMYNHLSRVARGVRPGARVAQRQVIGYVGATGLATGPHLDYRVAHNGRFVNPLSEKFIPGDPIAPAQRAEFQRRVRELTARLETEAPF